MTVFEMQQLFETLLQTQSITYNDSDKPDTDTILRYLNLGQILYIKEKYLNTPSFVDTTTLLGDHILELGTLATTTSLTNDNTATSPYVNSYVLTCNADYWHIIKINGKVSRIRPQVFSNTAVQLVPINIQDIDKYLTTINHIPIILKPVFVPLTIDGKTNTEIMVIFDKYTTYDINSGVSKMIYLKKPKILSLYTNDSNNTTECELIPYLHEEVVKYAISLFETEKYKLVSKNKQSENK